MDSIYDAAVKTGMAEGMAEGMAKGMAKGIVEGKVEGKAEGKAETFLVFARRKFKRVPQKWKDQVLSAAPEQIDDWLFQASTATSLASVFNGSAASGHGQARKKPNGSP